MRHSDPRLTLGIYTHSTPARLSESVGRLDALAGVTAEPFDGLNRADLIARLMAHETTAPAASPRTHCPPG